MTHDTPLATTMTVTVRDRSRDLPWGWGHSRPVTREITISTTCPVCGEQRGEPFGLNQYDDGDWYWVNAWINPCGHIDSYQDVLAEDRNERVAS